MPQASAWNVAVLLLLGCGGNGGTRSPASASKGQGSATVRIAWPARSDARLIPNAANSVTVTLSGNGGTATRTIARPTTVLTFSNLAYGDYTATATASPNADGSGVAQASGAGSVTVAENVPGTLDVALASTVATLVVGSSGTVLPNRPAQLTASARDARGAVVLLASGGGQEPITWTNDAPAVANLTPNGVSASLAYRSVGTVHATARLTVDDAGTQVSGSVDVPVAANLSMSLTPAVSGTVKRNATNPGSVTGGTASYLDDRYQSGSYYDPHTGFHTFSSIDFGIAEFDASTLPAGATIVSATYTVNLTSHTDANTGHSVGMYVGDGLLTFGDFSVASTSVGSLDSSVGPKQLDVTDALRSSIASGTRYVGIRLAVGGNSQGFANWSSPRLEVLYTPAP